VSEPQSEFISEPITPMPGPFTTGDMVRGEPGLPVGFLWRHREYRIVECLAVGKKLSPSVGDMYVRRHTFRLEMDDGSVWEVYFLRQPPKGSSSRGKANRWFLGVIRDSA
jgi:hypothetical protein